MDKPDLTPFIPDRSGIKWEKPSVKKEDDNKTLEELKTPLSNNNKDDLIVQDDKGHRYIVTSDQIKFKNGKLPNANTNFTFIYFEENPNNANKFEGKVVEGKVVYADNEMPDSEKNKVDLRGYNVWNQPENVKVREVRGNVNDSELFETLSSIPYDSIVLKTEKGNRFIFFSDELGASYSSTMPEAGQNIEIAGIKGEAIYVNYSDDKRFSSEAELKEFLNVEDKIGIISFSSNESTSADYKVND